MADPVLQPAASNERARAGAQTGEAPRGITRTPGAAEGRTYPRTGLMEVMPPPLAMRQLLPMGAGTTAQKRRQEVAVRR